MTQMHHLPETVGQLWQDYISIETAGGAQADRMAALNAFLAALKPYPVDVYRPWAINLCRQAVDYHNEPVPIRLPLFRDALFPALLEGLKSGDANCVRWMGGLSYHLSNCPRQTAQLQEMSIQPYDLLRLAIAKNPADRIAMLLQIKVIHEWLSYVIHEIPSGIICEPDKSVAECCREYSEDAHELEDLANRAGVIADHAEFISTCKYHFRHYPQYDQMREQFNGYGDYLERQDA